jgi:hypothetical protein
MRNVLKHKLLFSCVGVLFIGLLAFGAYQVYVLNKAHSTFNNYYAFRGCVQLIKKEPTYGICKTNTGQTIEMVLYHGKWYLKGDLPIGFLGHFL